MPKFVIGMKRVVEQNIELEVDAKSLEELLSRTEEVREAVCNDFDDCWVDQKVVSVHTGTNVKPIEDECPDEESDIILLPDGKIRVYGD